MVFAFRLVVEQTDMDSLHMAAWVRSPINIAPIFTKRMVAPMLSRFVDFGDIESRQSTLLSLPSLPYRSRNRSLTQSLAQGKGFLEVPVKA